MPTLRSNKKYVKHTYDLRWVMGYEGGKRTYGMWNQAGVCNSTRASLQPSKDRLFVGIQKKNKVSRDISDVIVRNSEDFIAFRWLAAIGIPGSLKKGLGLDSIKAIGSHQGCWLVTRDEKTLVLMDGEVQAKKNDEPLIQVRSK